MSGLLQKGARRFTTQIGAAGVPDAVATTIPLVSTTGLPTDTQIEIVIDRTDGSGVLTPSKEEVVRGTVSGLNLINCIRGVEGTAQAHGAGATVNSFLTASMWNNIIDYIRDIPSRGLIGGVINVSVASNNLTVAVKTLQGTDPSPSNPVGIIIGNQLRSITSALSVSTLTAGTNYFNAGSSELATKEIDYFVYVGDNAGTIFLGISRLPYGRTLADFNLVSSTSERAFWGASGTTSPVVNVGRFAATLSAGAGHTWSVPSFTNANLIQEPVYETRLLDCTATIAPESGSFTNQPSVSYAKYQIIGRVARTQYRLFLGNPSGGTGRLLIKTAINATLERNVISVNFSDNQVANGFLFNNDSRIYISKYDSTTVIGNGVAIDINGTYQI